MYVVLHWHQSVHGTGPSKHSGLVSPSLLHTVAAGTVDPVVREPPEHSLLSVNQYLYQERSQPQCLLLHMPLLLPLPLPLLALLLLCVCAGLPAAGSVCEDCAGGERVCRHRYRFTN